MKEILNTDKAPAAIGPYSQGVCADGLIFVSGQLPIDPQQKAITATDIAGQTEQALQNLQAILASKDATLDDVLKTTVYLQDMGDFADMNAVYARYFTQDYPARAAFEVARLPMDALVEIEAVALKKA